MSTGRKESRRQRGEIGILHSRAQAGSMNWFSLKHVRNADVWRWNATGLCHALLGVSQLLLRYVGFLLSFHCVPTIDTQAWSAGQVLSVQMVIFVLYDDWTYLDLSIQKLFHPVMAVGGCPNESELLACWSTFSGLYSQRRITFVAKCQRWKNVCIHWRTHWQSFSQSTQNSHILCLLVHHSYLTQQNQKKRKYWTAIAFPDWLTHSVVCTWTAIMELRAFRACWGLRGMFLRAVWVFPDLILKICL